MKKIASERNRACMEGGKLAIGYLLAGYPDKDGFLEILSSCETAGLDVFEIGYPSENPFHDGEIIRKAHESTDISLQTDLPYWKSIRDTINAPVWIMAYESDLIDTGFYKVLAENGLADALVIPDTSLERRISLLEELMPFGVDVLGFVNPDTPEKEQKVCFDNFPLIYQQLYSGPTGMPVEARGYEQILSHAKEHDMLKVFAGFGINSANRAAQLLESGFDGVIIGTAMISKLNRSREELVEFVGELYHTVSRRR